MFAYLLLLTNNEFVYKIIQLCLIYVGIIEGCQRHTQEKIHKFHVSFPLRWETLETWLWYVQQLAIYWWQSSIALHPIGVNWVADACYWVGIVIKSANITLQSLNTHTIWREFIAGNLQFWALGHWRVSHCTTDQLQPSPFWCVRQKVARRPCATRGKNDNELACLGRSPMQRALRLIVLMPPKPRSPMWGGTRQYVEFKTTNMVEKDFTTVSVKKALQHQ